MLIDCATLAAKIDDANVVVFDCRHDLMDHARGERLYREGHIAGAHFAHLETDLSGEKNGRNGRHPLPLPVAFAAFLARHGVSAATTVVAYDDVGGQFAARLWWLCHWIGHTNAALLDGGINLWLARGNALSTEVPVARAVALAAQQDTQMVVTANQLLSRLLSPTLALVDARAPERFRGEVEPIDPVAGHIPGALNRFYKENLNVDLTFKPADTLRAEWQALLAAHASAQVVHQCGSGVTACVNVFAMQLAGLGETKLYAGSWSEWVSEADRPIARE